MEWRWYIQPTTMAGKGFLTRRVREEEGTTLSMPTASAHGDSTRPNKWSWPRATRLERRAGRDPGGALASRRTVALDITVVAGKRIHEARREIVLVVRDFDGVGHHEESHSHQQGNQHDGRVKTDTEGAPTAWAIRGGGSPAYQSTAANA